MFVPHLFLASLAFTTIVASEIANEAGHVDVAHEASPAQDQGHAKPVHADARAIEDEDAFIAGEIAFHGSEAAQDKGLAKPVHADAKAIEDEDAESTTAIEIAFHGSDLSSNKLEHPSTLAQGAAEMTVQPSGEVLGGILDQAAETPLQSKQRTATKARRGVVEGDGTKHHSLHAAASPVLRAAMTPTASPDVADGASAVVQEVDTLHDTASSVLRTDATPTASPVAATRAQWTYNSQENKWAKASDPQSSVPESSDPISNIVTTFNFHLQRNLSRWKQILTQAEVGRIIYITILVLGVIFAVWFGTYSLSVSQAASAEAKEKQKRSIQKAPLMNDLASRVQTGMPQNQKDTSISRVIDEAYQSEFLREFLKEDEAPIKKDDSLHEAQPMIKVGDLKAMLKKNVADQIKASPGQTRPNIQVTY